MKPENLSGRFSEEWIRLMDDKIPEGEYAVASLIQDSSGVRILLDSGGHKVRIIFDGFPLLVQSSEEGLRMRTWGNVQRKYKDRFIFRKAVLFEVKNSSLVKWCVQESCGFYQEQNPQAKGFYEHMGFQVYKRTDLDGQGNPYPLLYMSL